MIVGHVFESFIALEASHPLAPTFSTQAEEAARLAWEANVVLRLVQLEICLLDRIGLKLLIQTALTRIGLAELAVINIKVINLLKVVNLSRLNSLSNLIV